MKIPSFVKQILGYNPKIYWQMIAGSFQDEIWQKQTHGQHQWLLQQIKIIKPTSILEVGCGFGRNIDFLLKNKIKPIKFSGVDFSSSMVSLAKKNLPKSINLENADATALPYKDSDFDLVFTHGLLMHLPPAKINKALSELVRVSKKNIIIIEEIRKSPGLINNHTWSHDYQKHLENFPVKIIASSNKFKDLICLNLKKLPSTSTRAVSSHKN